MSPTLAKSTGGALVLLGALYYYYKQKKMLGSLPPIASGYLPVIGHLLKLINPVPIHEIFTKWSQEVGPIYTLYFGSQRWIVLNNVETIKDLIVNRGTIYSSRKLPDTIVQDVFQGEEKGGGFAFFSYGAPWRKLRRIAHNGLIKSQVNLYQPILDECRTNLLSHLYSRISEKKGMDPTYLLEHFTILSILKISFGDICSYEPGDPALCEAFKLTARAAAALSPSDQLREFFPILKKIWPLKHNKYMVVGRDLLEFYGNLLKKFKASMEKDSSKVPDCFVKAIIQQNELTDLQIIHFIGLSVSGGSETSASTLRWMIAYLANHPEVQDKAYEDIKKVVGLERLPCASDESELPYVKCIIHETLRIRPPFPTSVPHSTSKDDTYKGWLIPQDTVIVLNVFAIHHDPDQFENPSEFKPERHMDYFLDEKKRAIFSQSVEDRPHLTFSTGRRVCVGINLAERNLYMAASMLLASFKIERVSDGLIDVDTPKDVRAPIWTPTDYNIRLVPRHDKVNTFT